MKVKGLYETHIAVRDLDRSIQFYEDIVGLKLSARFNERNVAFMSVGGLEKGIIGLWSIGSSPLLPKSHFAFAADINDLLSGPERLKQHGIQPKGLSGEPIEEAIVIGWMPAVSVYFDDPDGHSVEFIHKLQEEPNPNRGVIPWSVWNSQPA